MIKIVSEICVECDEEECYRGYVNFTNGEIDILEEADKNSVLELQKDGMYPVFAYIDLGDTRAKAKVSVDDGALFLSPEELERVEGVLGLDEGMEVYIPDPFSPFQLLRLEKDALYSIVEGILGSGLSESVDVSDMSLEFTGCADEDGECYIKATLKEFTVGIITERS